MRISIIGLPGSGKSTLAGVISKKLSIPHIQLDRFWFESGGRNGSHDTPNLDQVRERVRMRALAAIEQDSWVSDGFYNRLQSEIASRADILIFLDTPLWKRLFNHGRRLIHPATRHKEVSLWDDLRFFPEIVRRTYAPGPKPKEFAKDYLDKLVVIKSYAEADKYVASLSKHQDF